MYSTPNFITVSAFSLLLLKVPRCLARSRPVTRFPARRSQLPPIICCRSCVACGVTLASSHLRTGDRIEFNKSQIHGAFKDEKCLIFPADFKVTLLFEPDKSRFDLRRFVVGT